MRSPVDCNPVTFVKYSRPPKNCFGYHSIVWLFELNKETETVRFSFSICSPKDNFSKKIGRELAQQRFIAGDSFTMKWNPNIPIVDDAILHLKAVDSTEREVLVHKCLKVYEERRLLRELSSRMEDW